MINLGPVARIRVIIGVTFGLHPSEGKALALLELLARNLSSVVRTKIDLSSRMNCGFPPRLPDGAQRHLLTSGYRVQLRQRFLEVGGYRRGLILLGRRPLSKGFEYWTISCKLNKKSWRKRNIVAVTC